MIFNETDKKKRGNFIKCRSAIYSQRADKRKKVLNNKER